MQQSATMTVEEAGRMLGISRGSAYRAARSGEIPTIRLGRRVLVPRLPLQRLVGIVEPVAANADDIESPTGVPRQRP